MAQSGRWFRDRGLAALFLDPEYDNGVASDDDETDDDSDDCHRTDNDDQVGEDDPAVRVLDQALVFPSL